MTVRELRRVGRRANWRHLAPDVLITTGAYALAMLPGAVAFWRLARLLVQA